jgi:hypothetical protein
MALSAGSAALEQSARDTKAFLRARAVVSAVDLLRLILTYCLSDRLSPLGQEFAPGRLTRGDLAPVAPTHRLAHASDHAPANPRLPATLPGGAAPPSTRASATKADLPMHGPAMLAPMGLGTGVALSRPSRRTVPSTATTWPCARVRTISKRSAPSGTRVSPAPGAGGRSSPPASRRFGERARLDLAPSR